MKQNPAIFLDRDDTLIVDTGYMYAPEEFQWRQGAEEALRLFYERGLPVFVITNQGGIAREFFTLAQMHIFHEHLKNEARKAGGGIADIAYCPHHPLSVSDAMRTPCSCRKPAAGMIYDLAKKWSIDLKHSVVIGDRQTDIEAGERAGCHTFLLRKDMSLLEVAEQAVAFTPIKER